jgi:hypothetical protein
MLEDGSEFLVVGARHFDPQMHRTINLMKSNGIIMKADPNPMSCQGFMDQHRNWINRKDAWIIAEENGQIINDVSSKGTLYSENLY